LPWDNSHIKVDTVQADVHVEGRNIANGHE